MSRFVLTAELNIQPPTNAQIRKVINSVNSQLKGIKSPQIFNANQIKQQSAKASGAIAGTTKAANGLSLALARVKSRFAQRLIDASLFSVVNTAIAGVTGAIGNAVRSSIAFEKELAKVAQVTNKTVGELENLVDSIGELSTKFGTSSSELIGVARTLSQAGLSAQDVSIALKAVAETDLAPTFENMSKTAEGAIAIFGQFGTGARDLSQQLGEINELAGKFAVESGDLIEAIKRGGAAFKTSGGNLREYISLFTTVRSTTREGAAQISTGLRTIFTRIQRPKTIQYFRELGVELTDATGKFVGGFEAFKRLSDAFGNLEDGDIQLIDVAQQLGGVRQVTRVIPLLKNAAKTQEAYNKAAKGGNSIDEQRDKALNTLAARLNQVKESTLELGRAIMDSFGPALKGLADFLSSTIQSITAFIKAIDETFFAVDTLVRGAFDYEKEAPDLTKGTSGFLALGAAIGVASTAFLGFSGPVGLAIGAAAALVPIFARFVSGTDATANSTRLLTENIVALTAGVGGLLLVAKKAGTLGIISDVIAGGAGGKRAKGKGITKLFGNLAPTVSGIGEKFGATSSFDTSVTKKQLPYQSKKLGVATRAGNAAIGAGGGFLGAKAAQIAFGRTSTALKSFDKALKKATDVTGTMADIDAFGVEAANLQAQKDIDLAGQGIAVAAGGVASIFLGPVGGALVGALTGFAFEIIAQVPLMQAAFAALRDVLSYVTLGYVRSSQEIQLVAKTTALAQQSMAKTKKAVEDFNQALTDDKKDRRENEDDSAITGQEIADIANEQLQNIGSDIARLQENKDKILDRDGDGVRERTVGDKYFSKLSKEEEKAITETNTALSEKRKTLTDAFQKIAAETIANGGTFQDAFSTLSPELQRAIKELDIKGQLDQLFDDDSEFRKNVINSLEKTYIDALTKKVKLENQLATATISYLKVQDEAAQIIAEFGGAAYGAREKQANLLQQANAGTGGEFDLVDSLTKLNPQQLLKRAEQSGSQLAETRRKLTFQEGSGEKTGEQKRLEAQEKELLRLSKQTYDISKKLIDIRKQELNIIKARNEQERAGLEDALKGDFTKLFDAQAAQGVIASVATGGGVNGFSQTAIADAIDNLRSQQEAGATEAFGQNITSLIERVASGGLANVGLGGANAQVLAGTTTEEEQLKKEIRELAAVLPAAAQSEMQAAELQLQAARDQVRAAGQRLNTAGGDPQSVKDKKFAGNYATGGAIFRKRGTDSVPAMLTPGEFVVRRSAVQRGNNLNMLRAMNGGGDAKSIGGTVYASGGGLNTSSGGGEIDFSSLSKAANAMTTASNAMKIMVEKLGQLKLNVTLAPTNHNVNVTGTSALLAMGEEIQEKILDMVGKKLSRSKASGGGRLDEQPSESNLPSAF